VKITKTLTTLKDILTPLCKRRESVWVKAGWEHVFVQWPPIAREDIERLFTSSGTGSDESVEVNFSKSQRGQVLYLPPLEKEPHFVPILSLYCKLNDKQSIAKFRVMLVRLDDCFEENRKVYGIGFRMETPESMNQNATTTDNEGIHDFHHAQLIQKFGQTRLNKLLIDCPGWIPESQPSFPLPAKCPVTLLLCLIVTLYGRKCYNQFLDNYLVNYRKSAIEPYKKKLKPWINWKPN
jgi:hypothetical protein